ncbi:MAG: type II toxin-antitoxin system HicB family antitoxin [bacterium]
MRYGIVIERTRTGFSAWSPDLDGCVAAARSRPAVIKAMAKAIALHLEGLRSEGRRRPAPSSVAWVEGPRA